MRDIEKIIESRKLMLLNNRLYKSELFISRLLKYIFLIFNSICQNDIL